MFMAGTEEAVLLVSELSAKSMGAKQLMALSLATILVVSFATVLAMFH